MQYKEQIEKLISLLTFVPGGYVKRCEFAGRLVKMYGYEFLIENLPQYDSAQAYSKTTSGYYASIEDWQKARRPEWKAARIKQTMEQTNEEAWKHIQERI